LLLGNFAEASRFYEVAAELAPVAAAVDGLGCIALVEGRYDEAESFFREAYQMDGEYDEALLNLGLLRELQGRQEESRDIYLNYLEKYPDSVRARNDLFALEYDRGRGKMGILRELAKAQTLSDDPVVRANVAILKER
jgi:tetratricopeptide (TPR) repeat protein